MSRRMMPKGTSGGTTKGHQKGSRRTTSQQVQLQQQTGANQQQQTLVNNKEHNNNLSINTKSNPASSHSGSSVVVVPNKSQPNNKNPCQQNQQSNKQTAAGKILKDKNQPNLEKDSTSATTGIPPAPSSSPIPAEVEDEDVDDLEVEVDFDGVDDELDDEDEDLEDDDDEDGEDLDEDDEYDHEDAHEDLTEPCESRTPGAPGGPHGGGPPNNNSASSYNNSLLYVGSSSEEEDDDEGENDESLERDESDEDEEDDEDGLEPSGFLLPPDGDPSSIQGIPPDAQARLEAFFEAAGTGFTDGKLMSDPENLRKLTLTVSSALGEASAAINRMRDSQRKSLEEGRNDSMEEGDSLLALACSSGYFELARVLLAMGANVDDRGSKGDLTPLMDAASQGHLEIVKLLISHSADVNAQSACGNSPLMYACSAGHEEIVRELLKAGARVEDNNENGHTPLMEAASSGHVNVARILLEQGAGINTHSNEFKESALTVACYKGHLEMVRFLLDAGADQQHKTDEMHTALMEASMDGHVEVARLLLDSGAQVNMPADSFESPLTLAACGGHVELAELLIERGANIEEVNDEGYTPLMEAAREGHILVVKSLLKNNARINAETEETHETALTLSACGGFLDVVDTLCHHGADIETGASSPLMEAAQEGHYQVVKYLLDRGADLTRETQTGDTALSYACENGHVDVVELLVEKDANPEHLSEGGRTPLMKACRGGHVDVIKFLISKGADVNRQTASNDHTPLSLACAGGHLAAVEVLLAAGANPYHKLKDSSTMIIEAARGGHTNVIRALLDFAPLRTTEKGSQPGKQSKLSAATQSGQSQQKAQAVDSSKTGANQNQVKSVLRKSRSTSTLDSSAQQPPKPESTTESGEGKSKPLPTMTTIPADSPLLKNLNLPLGDGKTQVSSTSEDVRKKPVPVPAPTVVPAAADKNASSRKTATPSSSTTVGAATPCTECNAKPSSEQPHGHVHVKRSAEAGVPVSPGGNAPASSTTLSSSGSGSTTAITGPPLVPSQVTAATAISERPKAKANKPSARKQVQLQQQIQQQLQNQQQQLLQAGASPPGGDKVVFQQGSPGAGVISPGPSTGTSPGGGVNPPGVLASVTQDYTNRLAAAAAAAGVGGGGSGGLSGLKLTAPPNASSPYSGSTSKTLLQMQVQQVRSGGKNKVASSETHFTLDTKQLMQIFTQHHQSQLIYNKGDHKFECYDAGMTTYDSEQVIDFAQALAATAYPPSGGAVGGLQLTQAPGSGSVPCSQTPGGTTTTTTTTTVVVTHGNGETETIIEGDNLPPGTNEMIMSAATAAAAAFPLECYAMQSGGTVAAGGSSASGGQIQVQSYQLSSSPAGLSVGVGIPGDLATGISPLTTTTMHTTTIINSGSSNFQPQIILPHPPPLPAAISAAAAAAGLVPPSGAPPEGALRQLQQQQQAKSGPTVGKVVQGSPNTSTGKEKIAGVASSKGTPTTTQGTQATPPTSAVPMQKKQTGKRTRPFSQGVHGACSNNQKAGGQSHSVASTQTPLPNDKAPKALDVDSATDSNGETSLSIAASQGHYEVVEFLLTRKAHIEHRDKKGCTPLILAADGGHDKVVELLLNSGADLEAQSERTKDTALSLACTKGRYEVVELLLKRGANKEHRNVSDYTPLSLAASGGFVNIIKLLLQFGAEINSRTGSKLGISPLMLAAMNGNTAAVKLLLDMGSDINAQIETNKNTALTLACFQGRHEVVQLLLDRKANLEHRAKTGLTPLMEAANGGYVEVGKVLIEKGADVNAAPVPATRDTALTIAADKGHFRFVEMLIDCEANVDVRNKKGCTPLWLSCSGGHLDVCQVLQKARADVDAQDNRRISCLMAAFKKGHVKVVRWIVKFVKQFPNDHEMSRYFLGLSNEPELLKRAQQCMEYIKQAKDKQALEASKNANILLEELELEKSREESKKLAAAKRREKKKKKKQEKKQLFTQPGDNDDDRDDDNDDDDDNDGDGTPDIIDIEVNNLSVNASVNDPKIKGHQSNNKGKGNKENQQQPSLKQSSVPISKAIRDVPIIPEPEPPVEPAKPEPASKSRKKKTKGSKGGSTNAIEVVPEPSLPVPQNEITSAKQAHKSSEKENVNIKGKTSVKSEKDVLKEKVKEVDDNKGKKDKKGHDASSEEKKSLKEGESHNKEASQYNQQPNSKSSNISPHGPTHSKRAKGDLVLQGPEPLMGISLNPSQLRKNTFDHDQRESHATHQTYSASSGKVAGSQPGGLVTGKTGTGRKDDGWKEVTRNCTSSRSKKVIVPSSVISRVIGRGGCNINAIREHTTAHIEVEKQQKGQLQPERTIQIKGNVDATKNAYTLITALMNDPDVDIKKLIAQHQLKVGPSSGTSTGSGTVSTTPTPTLNANAFPVIGSASTPLPPIGQPMTAANVTPPASSSQQPLNVNTSSSAPVDIIMKNFNPGKNGQMKGSPTPRNVLPVNSSSPPLASIKSGSPPIKKPTVVAHATTSSNFEIGNFSVSEVNASEAYNKAYPIGMIGKRSMVFTPSATASTTGGNASSSNANATSFASKLSQQQGHAGSAANSQGGHEQSQSNWENRQRHSNSTPTSTGKKTPTSFGIGMNLSSRSVSTPPPLTTTTAVNGNHPHQNHRPPQTHITQNHERQQQQIPSVLQNIVQSFSTSLGPLGSTGVVDRSKDSDVISNGPSTVGGPVVESTNFGSVPRGLAPGANSNSIGSSHSTAGSDRSSSEISNQDQQASSVGFSPFNYTFSKTTGWYPGDLAVRENSNGANSQQSNFGASNLLASLTTGGSTSALSASRAMNFASVAASGISTSMSTTTAQMSQAPIGQGVQNGSNIVSGPIGKPQGENLNEGELPTADASKAPGYRGSTTMGSPILRMQQQTPVGSNVPNSNYNMEGQLSSHFSNAPGMPPTAMNHNSLMGYGNQPRQAYGPGHNQYQPQELSNAAMMSSHQQPMNGGNPLMYQNNSGAPVVGHPVPPVPTNVVLSSRLNPRAPSFKVLGGQQQQPQPTQGQQAANSAFASTQQNQFNNMQYKNMGGGGLNQQYGGRQGMVGPGRSGVGSSWSAYGNGNVEDPMTASFQSLAALTGPTGILDPAVLLSGIEGLHDNQNAMKMENRPIPRPIGVERQFKSAIGGGMGNIPSFSSMDCLDAGPLPQPIALPSGNHGSGGPPPPSNSWLGMYGNSAPQGGFPSSGQLHGGLSSHGPPGPGPRGDRGIGRRSMEDMDPNRMHEIHQMYDSHRMMNGGNGPPMMHMQNPPPHPNAGMYPFGGDFDHQYIEQWDGHLTDEKQHMQQGGWGGNKWGN